MKEERKERGISAERCGDSSNKEVKEGGVSGDFSMETVISIYLFILPQWFCVLTAAVLSFGRMASYCRLMPGFSASNVSGAVSPSRVRNYDSSTLPARKNEDTDFETENHVS